jgi:WD40 repeat protein
MPAAARAARWPPGDALADHAFYVRNGRNELVVYSAASGELLHSDLRSGNFVDVYDSMQAVLATRTERFDHFELAGCPGVIEAAIRLRDGSTLATCGVGGAEQRQVDGTVVRWPFFAGEGISVLAELSDGSVWVGSTSGRVAPLDASRPGYDHGEPVRALRPIVESRWLVVAGARGTVRVIDIDSGRALLTIPGRHVWVDVVDGSQQDDVAELISVSANYTTRYALPRVMRRAQFAGEHGLASVAWAADGSGVYATDGGGAVVWVPIDARESTQRHVFLAGVAKWISAAPDSGLVWASGIDAHGIYRVSTDDAGAIRTNRDFDAEVSMRRVGAMRDGVVVWLDYGLGIVVAALSGDTSERLGAAVGFRDLGTSSDGRCVVATGDVVRRGCLADAASGGRPAEALQWHDLASRSYVAGDVNPAGSVLVAARERVDVYTSPEVDDAEPEYSWVHPPGLVDVAWVGDDRVATGDLDGRVRVFRTDGTLLAEWLPHTARIGALAVSRDARWIASAGWDGAIHFADVSAIGRNDQSDDAQADSLTLIGSPE